MTEKEIKDKFEESVLMLRELEALVKVQPVDYDTHLKRLTMIQSLFKRSKEYTDLQLELLVTKEQ